MSDDRHEDGVPGGGPDGGVDGWEDGLPLSGVGGGGQVPGGPGVGGGGAEPDGGPGGDLAESLSDSGGAPGGAAEEDAGDGSGGWRWPFGAPRGRGTRRRRTVRREEAGSQRSRLTAEARMLILDCWVRSKLSADDFAPLVGVSGPTLHAWRKRFEEEGPAGLESKARGRAGSRLPEATRRAILLMKAQHPEWGQDRLHAMLLRTRGYTASPGAIGRVLSEEGYVVEEVPTRPHAPKVTRFERSRPNQLWQTDLFTFMLKRQVRRVYLVAYMDDYSRFIVGFGLFATASGAFVREVLEAAIRAFGAPEEVLTDNGPQYHTWRGQSAFARLCAKLGIRQIVSRPRHPQTLGKIERFWGTLWRECVQQAVFRDLEDARRRIGHFIDHYNFQRVHSGISGLVPADRFFEASSEVLATLKARVAANAKTLAQHGEPRKSFYLTGRVGDAAISLHAEGERVVMTRGDGEREEVDLGAPGRRLVREEAVPLPEPVVPQAAPESGLEHRDEETEPAPGSSPLDGVVRDLARGTAELHGLEDPESESATSGDDQVDDAPRKDDGDAGALGDATTTEPAP